MINIKGFEEYSEFELDNVFIRNSSIIAFSAKKWESNDPLEQSDTAFFVYYPKKNKHKMWAVRYLGEATGISACAAFKPSENKSSKSSWLKIVILD